MKQLTVLIGGVLAFFAPSARADIVAWLDFGEDAPGESIDRGHEGWADLIGFSPSQEGGGQKLVCHRKADKASPLLMAACAKGKHFKEVRLDVAETGDGKPVNFWEMTLKEVFVSSYTGASDANDGATEEICLEWQSVVFTYRVFTVQGSSYTTTTVISPDTDGDGMPDAYEQSVGLDSTVSNLGLDSDHDGTPDIEEYRLGTDPNNPTSFFKAVASMSTPDDGTLQLKWPSVAGEEYQIEYSPDLTAPFAPAASVTATAGETTYSVTRTLQAGFFRVTKILP